VPSLNPTPSRPPRLVLISPDGKRQEISIAALPFHIGRQVGCELILQDSRISRLQSRIVAYDGGYALEDMSSLHGTFVNGQKVLRHELRPNDWIDFGIAYSYRILYAGDGATIDELLEKVAMPVPPGTGSRGLHHLGILLEVARSFGTGVSLEDILTTVVDAALELSNTHRGVLLLRKDSGKLEPTVARDSEGTIFAPGELEISSSVIKRVMTSRRELIVSDIGEDAALGREESVVRLDLHTIVAIPIDKVSLHELSDATIATRQSELVGILYLDSQQPSSSFSDLDREVLCTLAREAAVVIENAQLFSAAREKARLDHELEIAGEIQRELQPKRFPQPREIEVAGFMLACHSVGGDCFDVTGLDDGRYGLFVGDIAGKGISASLLASMLQGVIGSFVSFGIPVDEILSRVNRYIYEHSPEDRYATLFYGTLAPSGILDYVNAGHVPALVRRRSGELEALPSRNFPVGLFPDVQYVCASICMHPGDFLVIYTDGVSEATNVHGELLDDARLRRLLQDFQGETAEQLAEVVRIGVQNFTEGAPQSDDITVLVAQYHGPATSDAL
jgi:sigma-B regulation protein RsbU (phosphoserine phosphatase)